MGGIGWKVFMCGLKGLEEGFRQPCSDFKVIVPARERLMLHLTCALERTLLVQVNGNLLGATMILCFD